MLKERTPLNHFFGFSSRSLSLPNVLYCSVVECHSPKHTRWLTLLLFQDLKITKLCTAMLLSSPPAIRMVFRNQTVRKSENGRSIVSRSTAAGCVVLSPRALFGFWPLPEQRSCFLLLAKASLAFENGMSVGML